jgi:murein DD-endopeptidase MepM/ murein hydrolase activator NlpD
VSRSGTLRESVGLALLLAAGGAVAAYATVSTGVEALLAIPVVEPLALRVEEQPAAATYVREEQFQRGDTLAVFLERLGLDDPKLARQRSLRELRPGTYVSAEVDGDGDLISLAWLSGRDTLVRVAPEGDGYARSESRAPLVARAVMGSAVIQSSLFAASDAAGVPDAIAMQLAEVFGGDIDFYRDLRKGDRFSVVYELYYLGGRAVRSGRVLAAEFVNQGRSYRAVGYGSGYYTPEGRNMRKTILRSPLELSRVTSGFGMRVHPIARTWTAHKGTDYAAAAGTRVRAVGDGVVDFVGERGGYGKVVVLRHQGQYKSLYAHLSRFPAGLRRGQRVAQNDTIGFVGQTGWATGPHLHYEFQVSGQPRNPRTLAMPSGLPVPEPQMADFLAQAATLGARLDLVANRNVASLDSGSGR